MRQSKLSGLLGICRKSGSLLLGTDAVLEAVRAGKRTPCLVLFMHDASANTKKRVNNCCAFYQIPCRELSISGGEFGRLMGKTGVLMTVGVTNEGFATAILKLYETENNSSEQRERTFEK